MKNKTIIILFTILLFITGCDLVVPPDPDPVVKTLLPTDYVFKTIDLLEYEYIGVTRIDCSKVMSAFTSTGRCKPKKSTIGQTVTCPLEAPFETLEFGCLKGDEVPAVYLSISYTKDAKDVVFPEKFGACVPASAGPAVGESPRYQTDPGYKVCLFEGSSELIGGRLSAEDNTARPIGMYVDFSKSEVSVDSISSPYHGPMTLVMDSRYFGDADRERAYQTSLEMFSVYRATPRQHYVDAGNKEAVKTEAETKSENNLE